MLGTANALMTTGDLNLVRNDKLRTQLVTYLDSMNSLLDDIRRFDETYYRPGVHALAVGPDIHQFTKGQGSEMEEAVRARPATIERIPFPNTMGAMLRDRSVYDGYILLLVAHRNQSYRYRAMLDETRALRVQVTAALGKK